MYDDISAPELAAPPVAYAIFEGLDHLSNTVNDKAASVITGHLIPEGALPGPGGLPLDSLAQTGYSVVQDIILIGIAVIIVSLMGIKLFSKEKKFVVNRVTKRNVN